MAKFCPSCGNAVEEGAKFCNKCGAAMTQEKPMEVLKPSVAQPVAQTQGEPMGVFRPAATQPAAERQSAYENRSRGSVGYSDRVNDPELLAVVKKNKKAAGIFGLFIIPLPLIGFIIYSFISDSMETGDAVKYGLFVSAVFLAFAIYSRLKSRASNSYEGVVTDKKQKERTESGSNDHDVHYTEYITYVQTTDGKKKKISERSNSMIIAYDYLQVGDKFKYHAQFAFPYELYDKTRAPYLGCPACGTHNSTASDKCKKCGCPLLK